MDTIGTVENPVMVQSAGEEQYVGCTGVPADTHVVKWLTVCASENVQMIPC